MQMNVCNFSKICSCVKKPNFASKASLQEPLRFFDDGVASAESHMQRDRDLITKTIEAPIVRFYEWDCLCATVGYSVQPEVYVRPDVLPIAKRPTGGGILFHGHDLAFSILVPRTHWLLALTVAEACGHLNGAISSALSHVLPEMLPKVPENRSDLPFCMAQPTPYDLLWAGYKIGGCAQRRTRFGLLHQVSLFWQTPPWESIATCVFEPSVVADMKRVCRSLRELGVHSSGVEKNKVNDSAGCNSRSFDDHSSLRVHYERRHDRQNLGCCSQQNRSLYFFPPPSQAEMKELIYKEIQHVFHK